jgi:predicted nucleic acid-binding protein
MNVDLQADYFLDTNILVYAYDRSAGRKHTIAAQFMSDCWENENGCLSIQVLQEFYVNVTHKLSTPLDHQTARQIVADLAQWRVQTPEIGDLLQAIDYQQDYHLSFWDAMIVQSAAKLGCRVLISEDLSSGRLYGNVKVINPFVEID